MIISRTISETKDYLRKKRDAGLTIGFVPTMGALHEGHLELMRRAKADNDLLVCSIFVNPIQFNNPIDLEKYPRDLDKDAEMLQSVGCDLLFAPSQEEMYPESEIREFDFGEIANVMEGRFRPGHFNGVAVVVDKLFRIMKPHRAYFGEKDFQQLVIIRKLVEQESLPVQIIPCPIVREEDGLAMSSRNIRLSAEERKEAPFIHQMLIEAARMAPDSTPGEIKEHVETAFRKHGSFRLEYFDIVDARDLRSIQAWDESPEAVACLTAYLGEVRLIDNKLIFRNFAAAK